MTVFSASLVGELEICSNTLPLYAAPTLCNINKTHIWPVTPCGSNANLRCAELSFTNDEKEDWTKIVTTHGDQQTF